MEEKTYKITLADGTVISGLRKSGTNYISETEIDKSKLVDNCAPMTIEDSDGNKEVHENGVFVQEEQYPTAGPGYYLVFTDKPEDTIYKESVQSQIDYLTMSTGADAQ